MTQYVKADKNALLNLFNVFSVIYAPLPRGREAIHRFNTLHVKVRSYTNITHHIKKAQSALFLHIHVSFVHTQ